MDISFEDKYFIDFKSKELCDAFISTYNKGIGHRCCNGKGVLLINDNSYQTINSLKNEFLKEKIIIP